MASLNSFIPTAAKLVTMNLFDNEYEMVMIAANTN